MKNFWPALIISALLWVFFAWVVQLAFGQVGNRDEQKAFCADVYQFTGQVTKANVIRLRMMDLTGLVPTDIELKERYDRVHGFVHGAAFVLDLAPIVLAQQWLKENDCAAIAKGPDG